MYLRDVLAFQQRGKKNGEQYAFNYCIVCERLEHTWIFSIHNISDDSKQMKEKEKEKEKKKEKSSRKMKEKSKIGVDSATNKQSTTTATPLIE